MKNKTTPLFIYGRIVYSRWEWIFSLYIFVVILLGFVSCKPQDEYVGRWDEVPAFLNFRISMLNNEYQLSNLTSVDSELVPITIHDNVLDGSFISRITRGGCYGENQRCIYHGVFRSDTLRLTLTTSYCRHYMSLVKRKVK